MSARFDELRTETAAAATPIPAPASGPAVAQDGPAAGPALDNVGRQQPRVGSVEALLAAVVEASRCMVAHADPSEGTRAAVAVLGERTGFDRAYVFEITPDGHTIDLRYQWAAEGARTVSDITGKVTYAIADFEEVFRPLFANRVYQSITPERTGANLELNQATGTRSDLMVPIFIDDHFWGMVGFDNCREFRRYTEPEVQALRGAALAIAAALQRQRLQQLVQGVNAFLGHMLGAADLDGGLSAALQALRERTGVDRVFVNRYDPAVEGTWPWCESRAPGVPAFVDGFGPGPWRDADFAEVALPLREGRVYRSLAPDRSGLNAAANEVNRSGSDLIVPVMVSGRYRACIGCDDSRATRRWTDDEVAVLQGAAQALAAAIERDEIQQARLQTERELAAQARQAGLAIAQREAWLMAATRAAQVLLIGDDFDHATQQALGVLGMALQAPRISLVQDLPTPDHTEPGRWQVTHEWFMPTLDPQIGTPLESGPYPSTDWWREVRSGRPAVLRSDFDRAGAERGNAVITTPIPGPRWQWLVIGFDGLTRLHWSEEELAVLQAAAACFGAALERRAAEQARAAEAAQRALRTQRHTQLLAAVAQSAEELLAATDLAPCMDRVLQRIGEVTRAQRACLAQLQWTPADPLHHGWQEIAQEWTRAGEPRQVDGPERRFGMRRDDSTWAVGLQQLQAEGRFLAHMAELGEPFRSAQMALGVVWGLVSPVVVDGECVALLGFDYATPLEDYDEADLAALQTVASTMGAALQRQALVQRSLADERQRTAEAESLNELLEAVLLASRALQEGDEIEPKLRAWLETLARAVDADVAILLHHFAEPTPDDAVARWACEWRRDGTSAAHAAVPATEDFKGWAARLERGQAVWAQIDDLRDPQSVRFWREVRCATTLLVPVNLDGRVRYLLCFDWHERQTWRPAYGTVLHTAAEGLAAALQRHAAVQATLAERERRLAGEQARADESAHLAQLLEGVVQSARGLIAADTAGFEAALLTWLGNFGRQMRAQRATYYDFALFAPAGRMTARMLCEWVREGVGGSIPVSFAAPYLIDPRGGEAEMDRMMCGEVTAFHADHLQGPIRDLLVEQGNASVLAVPIFIGGRQWGSLSFDFAQFTEPQPAVVAVLQTAADTLAAVLQRLELDRALAEHQQRALAAERQRTVDAQGLNDLLEGVLRASRSLQDGDDLQQRLNHWLHCLAEALGADVAMLIDFPDTPPDAVADIPHDIPPDSPGSIVRAAPIARWACEWRRNAAPRPLQSISATTDFVRWAARLRSGESVWAHIEDLEDPRSVRFWHETDCATNLLVPVRIRNEVRQLLCFDWRERRGWQPAFGTVLHTAAEGLAAALQRHAAVQDMLREREARLALAQQKATSLTLANRALLRATQSLTDTAPLAHFLGAVLQEATGINGARSAGVFLFDANTGVLRMAAFVCDGRQVDIDTDPRMVQWRQPVPHEIASRWVQEVRNSEHLGFDNRLPTADHPWPYCRDWHANFGHTHVIDISLFAGGQVVGVLGQCFCGDDAVARFDFPQSRALGHLAALAIRQHALAEAARESLLVSERERAERERLSELTAANDALRASMDVLAEATDESLFLQHCLNAIAQRSGAASVWLFREGTGDGLMRLVGSSRDGRFTEAGEPGDPPHFSQGFQIRPAVAERLRESGRLVWRLAGEEPSAADYSEGSWAWHPRQDHAADALHALTVGDRLVGLVGMVFLHTTPPSQRQQEQVHALCQPLALALELMRQGRIARRNAENAAVLSERNRLAREIHDGIAQTFLAIQMQLDSGSEPADADPGPAHQAMALARHGLNEARRAVAALRPYDLGGRDLPAGLQRMLLQRLGGSGIEPQIELPAHWQALPPEVEDHLYRIAQEAVNNVLRHAAAQRLRLELSQSGGETTVLISDDGRGFETGTLDASRGYGLEGMQQRALRIGARIEVISQPSRGTQVLVSWNAPNSPSVTAGTLSHVLV